MGRSQTILLAFAGSLAIHAIGLELYARFGSLVLAPPPRFATPTTKPAELVVSVDPVMMDFGEATGSGIAANKSEGDRPQEAREADENQAYLDRRMTGNSPDGTGRRLMPNTGSASAAAMQAQPAAPQSPANQQVKPTDLKGDALAMASPPPALVKEEPDPASPKPGLTVTAAPNTAVPVKPTLPAPQEQIPAPAVQPAPPAKVASGQTGGDPVMGVSVPHSDSDSDPFQRISGSVVFRQGRLDVQMGRKVTTVRPQLGVGGIFDALAMQSPSLVVEAHIDPEGRVTEVELPKKTGSAAIDEPTRNAVYQWTFEPTRDKKGRAIADVLFFEIDYR